ncbi:cytochrome c-type biogenesis protein [Algiphilus sp.]|uniref:cytochrome c-type biogenesis protein n=1 Tax=Algiphilus sp. TaxID=1872431 RepID=UPI0025C12632|nr:cytochrome c-type biogenesis protein [Algiphilus sp.]MCI5063893.1 cytochrome c-type biogenesis protein CcmH [Algiphilus sp.]MCI5104922.1 cytochrome c-type biogenesis protein CcmH [Algiphilus sp.]
MSGAGKGVAMRRLWLSVLCVMMLPGALLAAIGDEGLSAEQRQRFHQLTTELRCLVCQNQSIAESNADLALDLKRQVRQQILEGRSDDAIRTYMRERYGDFVLYKPAVEPKTYLLWASPALLLLIALFILARRLRRAGPEDDEADEELS